MLWRSMAALVLTLGSRLGLVGRRSDICRIWCQISSNEIIYLELPTTYPTHRNRKSSDYIKITYLRKLIMLVGDTC